MVNNCCLSLYLNIAGVRQSPGKMLLGSWKVLEIFVTKRVGTLNADTVCDVSIIIVLVRRQCRTAK